MTNEPESQTEGHRSSCRCDALHQSLCVKGQIHGHWGLGGGVLAQMYA